MGNGREGKREGHGPRKAAETCLRPVAWRIGLRRRRAALFTVDGTAQRRGRGAGGSRGGATVTCRRPVAWTVGSTGGRLRRREEVAAMKMKKGGGGCGRSGYPSGDRGVAVVKGGQAAALRRQGRHRRWCREVRSCRGAADGSSGGGVGSARVAVSGEEGGGSAVLHNGWTSGGTAGRSDGWPEAVAGRRRWLAGVVTGRR